MSERLDLINRWFAELVPHNRALGMRAVAIEERGIVSELPYDPRLVGDPATGVLHGGAITALVDATCGMSVVVALAQPQRIATLDLRIDHLRPAAPGRAVLCRADCYRVTRRVAFVHARAHHGDDNQPIAAAAGTFVRLGDWFEADARAGGDR